MFNVKGYDGKITLHLDLGNYYPHQDLVSHIPQIKEKITMHFTHHGLFPGLLYIILLDNDLDLYKLGHVINVRIPCLLPDTEEIIYNIIKENMVNSK